MLYHLQMTSVDLKTKILAGEIRFGGNTKLKIYGTLTCTSGKRMKKQNRVFFYNEKEAITAGFRPCGHCLRKKYLAWMSKYRVEKPSTSNQF